MGYGPKIAQCKAQAVSPGSSICGDMAAGAGPWWMDKAPRLLMTGRMWARCCALQATSPSTGSARFVYLREPSACHQLYVLWGSPLSFYQNSCAHEQSCLLQLQAICTAVAVQELLCISWIVLLVHLFGWSCSLLCCAALQAFSSSLCRISCMRCELCMLAGFAQHHCQG